MTITGPTAVEAESIAPVGSHWRNRFTDKEVRVLSVGPCYVLGGRIRVWEDSQLERDNPSNGWGLDEWLRYWERIDGA